MTLFKYVGHPATMDPLVPFVVIREGALYVRIPISKLERKALELGKHECNGSIVCRVEEVRGSRVRCGPAVSLPKKAWCVQLQPFFSGARAFIVPNKSGLRHSVGDCLTECGD